MVLEYRDPLENPVASDTSRYVVFDVTPPAITLVAPREDVTIRSNHVSYLLTENLSTATISWRRTGGKPDNRSPHVVTLRGRELLAGEHRNIILSKKFQLVEGAEYSVTFDGSDAAGNRAETVTHKNIKMKSVMHLLDDF